VGEQSRDMLASVAQTGKHMALFGLLLGGGVFLLTRGLPPTRERPYSRGKYRAGRLMAMPLLVIGVAGLVIWLIGSR